MNCAMEGQQLGTWALSQLGLVGLVGKGETQGPWGRGRGLWAEATQSQLWLQDDASLSTRQKNTRWLPAPGCFQKRNLI